MEGTDEDDVRSVHDGGQPDPNADVQVGPSTGHVLPGVGGRLPPRVATRTRVTPLERRMGVLEKSADSFKSEIRRLEADLMNSHIKVAALTRQVADAKIDIAQLETEVQNKAALPSRGTKPKDPEAFHASREVKVIQNFSYDCEQFFKSVKLTAESDKIFHASTFLTKDAKLWWRNHVDDVANGRHTFTISTWEELKNALRKQFLPIMESTTSSGQSQTNRNNSRLHEGFSSPYVADQDCPRRIDSFISLTG